MTESLNVLLIESESGAGVVAKDELERAGHTVHYCHEAGNAAFPCNALIEGRRCPIEGAPIDVALDVRRRPRSQPTPLEDGVTCALRHFIPVVVAGRTVLNPYAAHASEMLDRDYDVVDTCERAARAPLEPHTAAAEAALREVLARRAIAAAAHVVVRHRDGALLISVSSADGLDTSTKSMAAVRMTAAVRAIDKCARGVDVVFGVPASP